MITLTGYEKFREYANGIEATKTVFYFTGTKDESGVSWCPDCVEALPYFNKAVEQFGENHTVVTVDVGDRSFWKDMKNPFRLDKDVHLNVIPTLVFWKKPQRLEGEQCTKSQLLEMFFTDED